MGISQPIAPLGPGPDGYSAIPAPQRASVGAITVPTDRQTALGALPLVASSKSHKDYQRQPVVISSPRLSPSAVSSEQALQARNLLAPLFRHNQAATQMLRISNSLADAPRFSSSLDILA